MLSKFKEIFCETLEIDADEAETASTETVETWDSLHHMNLVAALEDEFSIELEPDEVMDMTSYKAVLETLKKHGVAL
jgi:acyl carrier protein